MEQPARGVSTHRWRIFTSRYFGQRSLSNQSSQSSSGVTTDSALGLATDACFDDEDNAERQRQVRALLSGPDGFYPYGDVQWPHALRLVEIEHERCLATSALLGHYIPGSGDWGWEWEFVLCCRDDYFGALVEDIKANGIQAPVVLGDDGRVWDGHHRITAAVLLRLDVIPIITADQLTDDLVIKNRESLFKIGDIPAKWQFGVPKSL